MASQNIVRESSPTPSLSSSASVDGNGQGRTATLKRPRVQDLKEDEMSHEELFRYKKKLRNAKRTKISDLSAQQRREIGRDVLSRLLYITPFPSAEEFNEWVDEITLMEDLTLTSSQLCDLVGAMPFQFFFMSKPTYQSYANKPVLIGAKSKN